MNLTYRYFFIIDLLHHYYRDGKCRDIEIIPTSDCLRLMQNHHMLLRMIGSQLRVGIEMSPADDEIPVVPIEEGTVFRFYLKLKNPSFYNFTNLPLNPGSSHIYYFSNRSGQKAGNQLFLSAPVDSFDSAASYLPGDVVSKSGNLFENIKRSKGKPTSDRNFWKQLTSVEPVVTKKDLIPLSASTFRTAVRPPSKKVTTKIFGLNRENDGFDTLLLPEEELTFTEEQEAAAVNFFKQETENEPGKILTSGRYRIAVNDADLAVYHDHEAMMKGVFGLIEIFHYPKLPADFQLLKNGKVREDFSFRICFHNRSTIWKYLLKDGSKSKIIERDSAIKFSKEENMSAFRSEIPIELKEEQEAVVAIKFAEQSDPVEAMRPGTDVLKAIRNDDGEVEYYCSEIYLNY